MAVLVFKVLQFVVLSIFIVFISDFRKKNGMVPLIGEKWTYLLKASYLAPFAVYAYVLFNVNWLSPFDILALSITLAGTGLVVKAKRDLSANHTWVGYCFAASKFTSNGIYAYIRHPIYTGIYIVVLGSFCTIIPHVNFASYITLATAALISIAYIMGFLAFLANKETKTLIKKHGTPFQHYKEKVHPCLPLKKYTPKNANKKSKKSGC